MTYRADLGVGIGGPNHEVDFVLRRGPHLLGIEVKSGRHPAETPGLVEFERRFPGARGVVVGEQGVPLVEFLSVPADHWLEGAGS